MKNIREGINYESISSQGKHSRPFSQAIYVMQTFLQKDAELFNKSSCIFSKKAPELFSHDSPSFGEKQ